MAFEDTTGVCGILYCIAYSVATSELQHFNTKSLRTSILMNELEFCYARLLPAVTFRRDAQLWLTIL